MADSYTKNHKGEILFSILAVINSSWIFYVYLSITNIGNFKPALLTKALDGTIERPYAYRILIPLLAKTFSNLIPLELVQSLTHSPIPLKTIFDNLSRGAYPREAAFIITILYLSLLGFAYAERAFVANLGMNAEEQMIVPLFAQLLIIPFTALFGFYYDLPQLFLVTLTLVFLHRRNWKTFLVLLAITTLNKETSVLIIPVFLIYYWRKMPRKEFFKLLAWQLGIYAIIRFILAGKFHNNPGSPAFLTIREHYFQYVRYPSTFIYTFLFFSVIILLIKRQWKKKHEFLQAGSVIGGMITLLFFTSGMPFEFRVFLDALPVLAILIAPPLRTHIKNIIAT